MIVYSLVTLWYIPLRFRVSEERQFCLFPLPINLTYTKEAISSGVKLKQNATLFKKRLWHRCFPVNFAKFLRTPFSIEHLQWLLLNMKYKKEILSQIFYLTPSCIMLKNDQKYFKNLGVFTIQRFLKCFGHF